MTKILYVEDEVFLAKIVKESLQSRAYDVLHLLSGEHVLAHFIQYQPDICLLDVMLPIKDGLMLAKEIRAVNPSMPIIFITAKNQTTDVLDGFKAGGNDYIKKPFSLEELIVRIHNLCHLTSSNRTIQKDEQVFYIGKYAFWPNKLEIIFDHVAKRLSYREGQILMLLAEHKNEVVNRKHILDTLWGDDNFFNSRNLDVYITKLRQYFKQDDQVQILTLKAVGYRLIDN
jgi:two-component system, OmpR family, response regulator VicR